MTNTCIICGITLESRRKKQRHYSGSVGCKPKAPRQFRCCDCDREFLDHGKFMKHIRKGCSNKRHQGLPPVIHAGAVRGGGDRRSDDWCDKCNFGFGTASELSSHMEFGVHRRFTPGLKPIRGDVGYDGPLEDDRAEMLDLLDSLRLTGQASGSGDSGEIKSSGDEQSG